MMNKTNSKRGSICNALRITEAPRFHTRNNSTFTGSLRVEEFLRVGGRRRSSLWHITASQEATALITLSMWRRGSDAGVPKPGTPPERDAPCPPARHTPDTLVSSRDEPSVAGTSRSTRAQ